MNDMGGGYIMSAVGGYGFWGTSTAVILVLFILIAIVARTGRTDVGYW
jgi:hypothetical protein